MKRIIKIMSLFLCLCPLLNVKAFSNSITMSAQGDKLTLNSSLDVVVGASIDASYYPGFFVKNTNEGTVICLSGIRGVNAPSSGTTCNLISSTNYGVAYIIDLIYNTKNTESYEKYYWAEVLVNGHLGTLAQLNEPNSQLYVDIIGTSKPILTTGLSFSQILANAKKYEASVVTNPSITVDGKESINLTFTKNEDGYYYSNPITISSDLSYDMGTLSNSKFTYTKNGNSYTFKIKESDIELGNTETFSKTITITSSYMTSSRYDCGASVQNVGLTKVETKSATDSITITGGVTRENIVIQISKVDENNELLPGAQFMFQTEEQKKNNMDGEILTSTEEGNIIIENLSDDTYYLTEITSPSGYNKLNDSIKIVISSNGQITVDGEENPSGIIKIKNKLTRTEISKVSVVDGKELPGATLQILNSDNKNISCRVINKDGKEELLDTCSWVSGEEPVIIVGLNAGKYYLVETIAPEGYELNTEKREFEVKGDGTVTKVKMENHLYVEVPSTLSGRSALLLAIAMVDIAIGIGIITYVKKNKIKE